MIINNEITYSIIIFFIILFSSFIHSSTGFGFAVFAMTMLTALFPLTTSVALGRLALLIITLIMVTNLWKHINWRFIITPCVSALIGNTLGFYLLMITNASVLNRGLGAVLFILGMYMFFFNGKIRFNRTVKAGILSGFTAGLMGGLFNLGGIPLVIYYLSAIDDKLEYTSSMQATNIINSIYINILTFAFGFYSTPGIISYSVAAIAAVLVGCFLGLKVLKRINKETIGKFSYSYMVLTGLIMVFK